MFPRVHLRFYKSLRGGGGGGGGGTDCLLICSLSRWLFLGKRVELCVLLVVCNTNKSLRDESLIVRGGDNKNFI